MHPVQPTLLSEQQNPSQQCPTQREASDPICTTTSTPQMGNCLDFMSNSDQHLQRKLLKSIAKFITRNVDALESVQKIIRVGNDTSPSHTVPPTDFILLAIDEICRHMDVNVQDPILQQRACLGLQRISNMPVPATYHLDTTKAIRAIIRAMDTHKSSFKLQDNAILALYAMATEKGSREVIVSLRGLECISWAMKQFQENAFLQSSGAQALARIAAECPEAKRRAGKLGAVDIVIAAMDTHERDENVHESACSALRNLTDGVQTNQWLAARAFAIEATIKSLKAFPNNSKICYDACIAIGNICSEDEESRSRTAEIGLIVPFILCLKRFLRDETFQEYGLLLLRNMSRLGEEVREDIGENEGIQVALRAMQIHRGNMAILEHGCGALRYLLFSRDNRTRMLECEGLELLVGATRDGSESVFVSEKSILSMGNAVFDILESKREVARQGGIAAITKIMSRHLHEASIQEYGCRALQNLADSDILNNMMLSASGAVDAAIFAMIVYPDNIDIQEQGCALLLNTSCCEESIQRMRGLDAVRVLSSSRERNATSLTLQNQIETLLQVLDRGRADEEEDEELFGVGDKLRTSRSSLAREASLVGAPKIVRCEAGTKGYLLRQDSPAMRTRTVYQDWPNEKSDT